MVINFLLVQLLEHGQNQFVKTSKSLASGHGKTRPDWTRDSLRSQTAIMAAMNHLIWNNERTPRTCAIST